MLCQHIAKDAAIVSGCHSPSGRTSKVERTEPHPNSGCCWALPESGLLPTILNDANLCGAIPWVRGEQWLPTCFRTMKRSKAGLRLSAREFPCPEAPGNWSYSSWLPRKRFSTHVLVRELAPKGRNETSPSPSDQPRVGVSAGRLCARTAESALMALFASNMAGSASDRVVRSVSGETMMSRSRPPRVTLSKNQCSLCASRPS